MVGAVWILASSNGSGPGWAGTAGGIGMALASAAIAVREYLSATKRHPAQKAHNDRLSQLEAKLDHQALRMTAIEEDIQAIHTGMSELTGYIHGREDRR